ncbi:hypothetical protein BGZ49_004143, partial [Haplosporangium sp. Z 27]
MAIMPITTPTTLQSAPLESPSANNNNNNKSIKTSPPSRANSQPCYDKDLPPTPTSSSHLGSPDLVTLNENGTPQPKINNPTSLSPPTEVITSPALEPTPDNSTLRLASSVSSASSASTSASPATPMIPAIPSNLLSDPDHRATVAPTLSVGSTTISTRPQSIALASGNYERDDMYVSFKTTSPDNTNRTTTSKRVTLMDPPPPYAGVTDALSSQQQQYTQRQPQEQHVTISSTTHEYRASGPESALILSKDNTPSSSRTTTTTLATRISTTPEPSNGLHQLVAQNAQERNGIAMDDHVSVPATHRRSESSSNNNNNDQFTNNTNNGDHRQDTASLNGHPEGQGNSTDNAEDPSRIKPRRVLGNYHMSKTLGAGSMGKVKLGVHSRTRDK